MSTLFILVVIAVMIAAIALYNRLVNSRNRVDSAWSDVDVQLQRRHDLIPQLVSAVDQYAKYEKATLTAVTELRNQATRKTQDIAERGDVEEQLEKSVRQLLALSEDYPDLKANENFLQLQGELVETENYLQFARRYYNASVRDYNTMTETVPSNVVAGLFKFTQREFFQKSSDAVAQVPSAKVMHIE